MKLYPCQKGCAFFPKSSEFTLRCLLSITCQQNLKREATRRFSYEILEPSEQIPFDVKTLQLYSKFLWNHRTPHPVFKANPKHPLEERYFSLDAWILIFVLVITTQISWPQVRKQNWISTFKASPTVPDWQSLPQIKVVFHYCQQCSSYSSFVEWTPQPLQPLCRRRRRESGRDAASAVNRNAQLRGSQGARCHCVKK